MLGYLRKHAPVSLDLKLRFATEASAGLAYLESKRCIHRSEYSLQTQPSIVFWFLDGSGALVTLISLRKFS